MENNFYRLIYYYLKLKGLIITSEYPTLPKGKGNNAMRLVFSLKQDGKEVNVIANQ